MRPFACEPGRGTCRVTVLAGSPSSPARPCLTGRIHNLPPPSPQQPLRPPGRKLGLNLGSARQPLSHSVALGPVLTSPRHSFLVSTS